MPVALVLPQPVAVAVPQALPPWLGGGGSTGFQFNQSTPSASWSISHNFGRLPIVQIYVAGALVIADVTATPTLVTVVFPSATAGVAILT